MKNKSFATTILLLIMSLCMLSVQAKESKIKYSKFVEYIGEADNKIPNGKGTMTIYSRIDKKDPLITITGDFSKSSDNLDNISVSEANAKIQYGISLASIFVTISFDINKAQEDVHVSLRNATIDDRKNAVKTNGTSNLNIKWKKGEKEWIISFISPKIGTIESNPSSIHKNIPNILSEGDNLPKQESYSFSIFQASKPPHRPFEVILEDFIEATYQSGLKVKKEGDINKYLFPNGNYAKYGPDKWIEAKLDFTDGKLSLTNNSVNLNFNDGTEFKTTSLKGIGLDENKVPQLHSVNQISFIDGTLYKSNDIYDIYSNSLIVGRGIADGSIRLGNGQYRIEYKNGEQFTGDSKNFIKNPEDFLIFKSVKEAIPNNGTLTKSSNECDFYKNGEIIGGRWKLSDGGYVEYINNSPVKVIYPNGKTTATGRFKTNPPYSPNLQSSDYVLDNGSINNSGRGLKFTDGKPASLKNRNDIESYAASQGYECVKIRFNKNECHLSYAEGDDDTNTIKINTKDNTKQLNNTDFFINVAPNYRFSWPKSYITKGYTVIGNNPAVEVRTCKLKEKVHYFSDETAWPADAKHYMMWVYKPVPNNSGMTYGITKGLYLLNRADEIEYDLSDTFVKGNNRAFKEVRPAPKKKQYHKKGRIEECGVCLGTGQGWGSAAYCPFCGGKGWYVEHEW